MSKHHLLNESEVFCMLPWVHAYVEPTGKVLPCCNTDGKLPFGSVKTHSVGEIINSEQFKQIRLNMLAGVKSESCKFCYKTQEISDWNFRTYSNGHMSKFFDEAIGNTEADGTLNNFKMRYYDIRFSNLCNFKCRTCGGDFSSQWAVENKMFNPLGHTIIHADDHRGGLLSEVLEHINNIEIAYFAGGEPLITEEHYLILEELIKHGRTDVVLRYNTNMSNLNFKNYDLMGLWKNFKRVEVSASIDHYGERAEYIRHGTDWGKVESNLKSIRNHDFIDYQFNTVLSAYNYATLAEFYEYMIAHDLYRKSDAISLFQSVHPEWCTAQILPREIKVVGSEKLNQLITRLEQNRFYSTGTIKDGVAFTESHDTWEQHRRKFQSQVKNKDIIRGEDFCKTFPELAKMMDE